MNAFVLFKHILMIHAQLAHPDFLLHPKKKVKRKVEAEYEAKKKKTETVDFKLVRSAILRSQHVRNIYYYWCFIC